MAAALLAVAACAGCLENRATPPPVPGAGNPEPVVRRGELRGRYLVTGELKAVEATDIRVPRTPTWRMPIRWLETDGIRVTRGDKILELDNSQFSGQLEQQRLAEATTLNEQAQKRADVRVQLADKTFAVQRQENAVEKALIEARVPAELRPFREYQEKQLALERARVALEKAQEELESYRESSQAELEVLRIKLSKHRREIETAEAAIEALTLYAPVDGILIVSENRREGRKFQVGDSVWVGLSVMRIPDLSAMRVEARLSDVDDGRITPGMPATCTLDTYPGIEFPGEVTEIAPIAQEYGRRSLRRSFRVKVRLGTTDPERMRPGMSVKVVIEPRYATDGLLVPRRALDLESDPPKARLAGGDTVEVRLGPCNPWDCVIEEGLEEGARLEVAG